MTQHRCLPVFPGTQSLCLTGFYKAQLQSSTVVPFWSQKCPGAALPIRTVQKGGYDRHHQDGGCTKPTFQMKNCSRISLMSQRLFRPHNQCTIQYGLTPILLGNPGLWQRGRREKLPEDVWLTPSKIHWEGLDVPNYLCWHILASVSVHQCSPRIYTLPSIQKSSPNVCQ